MNIQLHEWRKVSVMLGEMLLINRPNISNSTKKEMEIFAKIEEHYEATNKAIKELEKVPTYMVKLLDIKRPDEWVKLIWALRYKTYEEAHPELANLDDDGEALTEGFHKENTDLYFEHGEYANLKIVFDKDLNIVGGRVLLKDERLNN